MNRYPLSLSVFVVMTMSQACSNDRVSAGDDSGEDTESTGETDPTDEAEALAPITFLLVPHTSQVTRSHVVWEPVADATSYTFEVLGDTTNDTSAGHVDAAGDQQTARKATRAVLHTVTTTKTRAQVPFELRNLPDTYLQVAAFDTKGDRIAESEVPPLCAQCTAGKDACSAMCRSPAYSYRLTLSANDDAGTNPHVGISKGDGYRAYTPAQFSQLSASQIGSRHHYSAHLPYGMNGDITYDAQCNPMYGYTFFLEKTAGPYQYAVDQAMATSTLGDGVESLCSTHNSISGLSMLFNDKSSISPKLSCATPCGQTGDLGSSWPWAVWDDAMFPNPILWPYLPGGGHAARADGGPGWADDLPLEGMLVHLANHAFHADLPLRLEMLGIRRVGSKTQIDVDLDRLQSFGHQEIRATLLGLDPDIYILTQYFGGSQLYAMALPHVELSPAEDNPACADDSMTAMCELWCADIDLDGFGDVHSCVLVAPGEEPPAGHVDDDTDCDDADPNTWPGAAALDDPGACMTDADADGWGEREPKLGVVVGRDCDDADVDRVVCVEPVAACVDATQGNATPLLANVTGGDGNYGFAWTPGETLDDPMTPAPLASPGDVTTYTVTATDGLMNMDSDHITVHIADKAWLLGGVQDAECEAVGFMEAELNYAYSQAGTQACSTSNTDPIAIVCPTIHEQARITGTLGVTDADGDDDVIGFVWGWQSQQQFYLFQWKQSTQFLFECATLEGMTVRKFDAQQDFGHDDFTCDFDTANVSILAHPADIYSSGWESGKEYGVEVLYTHAQTEITITDLSSDVVVVNFVIMDDSYPTGKFGTYTFSQANACSGPWQSACL